MGQKNNTTFLIFNNKLNKIRINKQNIRLGPKLNTIYEYIYIYLYNLKESFYPQVKGRILLFVRFIFVRTPSKPACHHYHLSHFAKGRPRVTLYGRCPERHDFFDQNGGGGMLAWRAFRHLFVRMNTRSICHYHHLNHFAKGRPRVTLYGRCPERHDFFDQSGGGGMLAWRAFRPDLLCIGMPPPPP